MEQLKVCNKCNKSKNLSEFSPNKLGKNGVHSICRLCKNNQYIRKEKSKTHRVCRKCNLNKSNGNFYKRSNGYLGIGTICEKCSRQESRDSYYKNKKLGKLKIKTKITLSFKVCRKCNTNKKINEFKSQQAWACSSCRQETRRECQNTYNSNNKFKVAIRNLVYQSFKRACEGSYIKSQRTEDILGCSMKYFKGHLETQFQEGMNWDNYGKINSETNKVWHIDHKIPLTSAKTEEDIIKLCHYSNLQPLWALENIKKSNKICIG